MSVPAGFYSKQLSFDVLPFHNSYFIIGKPREFVDYLVDEATSRLNVSLEGE